MDEQKSLEKELGAQRDLAAPVRKIPVELLAVLFVAHVEEGGEIADVALTCKLWRDIAFRTAEVWSRITIRHRTMHWHNLIPRGVPYNRIRFPCRSHSVLQLILKRSGSSLLTINLDFKFGSSSDSTHHSEASKILHTLNNGAFLRCVSLTLNSSPGVEWENSLEFEIPFQPLRMLRTLVVTRGWFYATMLTRLLQAIEDTAPAFKSLLMAQSCPGALEGQPKLLERLRDVQFNGFGRTIKTIKLSQSTTTLYLRDLVVDLDPADRDPFPRLRTASLDWRALRSLGSRMFPSITELEIDTESTERTEKVDAQFPALCELSITGVGWQLARQFTNSAQFPALRLGNRNQMKSDVNGAMKKLWNGSTTQPRPIALRIYICMSEAAFIAAMKKLPDLRELAVDIVDDTLKSRFFGELGGSLRKSDNRMQWKFLPQLEKLVFYTYGRGECERTLRQNIFETVESRKGSRLRSIRIYYAESEDPIDDDGNAPYAEFLVAPNGS